MKRDLLRRSFVAVVLFAAVVSCRAEAVEPKDARVVREIGRLETVLKGLDPAALPKDVLDLVKVHEGALGRVKGTSSPELRLYRLRDAFVGVETLAFLAREKSAGDSAAAFRKLWDASRIRFEEKAPAPAGTLLERGLVESSASRAERLYRASLPYAKASALWSGVYYLGEADANLRFRDFVQSLAGRPNVREKGPGAGRIAAAIEAVERDTLKLFAGDVANQKLIPVSVRLKEARELLDAGRTDGATLLLVEARVALMRRGGPRGSYGTEAGSATGSMVSLLNAWAADEEAPMKELVQAEVVPFFGSLLLPAPSATKTAAEVRVTLVRWPYT